ncbi:MAG: Fic family protein [Planctomycetaceae bacterium]|nr:Fic family protein [Planctomycetaceae bacterium]
MNETILTKLPYAVDLETKPVLKALVNARSLLARLNGTLSSLPKPQILINTLALQEAKESSEIENIITTQDELFRASIVSDRQVDPSAKEVRDYVAATLFGYELIQRTGLLKTSDIIAIQQIIKQTESGIRRGQGVVLRNEITGEIMYRPPQDYMHIMELLDNLAAYINDDSLSDVDPLIKMAVIHYQFEAIHPFMDGNGRTGRIINILYLIMKRLLDYPVLYLSRYIIQHKSRYYDLLHRLGKGTADAPWEEWLLYMLDAVAQTSEQTVITINVIHREMRRFKRSIRGDAKLRRIYSQDLINHLFEHPYTKIDLLASNLGIERRTATKYLNLLYEAGFLCKHRLGKSYYYVNDSLWQILESAQNKVPEM